MNSWPALPLEAWRDTYATLHMYTQVVGKVRLALAPPANHWWHVPLYVGARGLTTSAIPYGDRVFELRFDFLDHSLVLETAEGAVRRVPLGGSVKDFHRTVMETLQAVGVEVRIWPCPVEVQDPVPFEQDDRHATYDPAQAARFWEVLRRVDAVFKEFRGRFSGKCSPVHFFWGSFDLATTRFSGRPAEPKPDADAITRAAYNAELSSLGFWPGGQGVEAAFYSYAYPEPKGFGTQPIRPAPAFYDERMGEFLLMYDDVRRADDPRAAVLEFGQSAYEAAARLQDWPRAFVSLNSASSGKASAGAPPGEVSGLAASKAPNPGA